VTLDYLFYSSLTLGVMSGSALALAILFRLRFRRLSGLPKDPSASIFDKTFVIFNPYSDQKRSIHRLLAFLPFIAFAVTFGLLALAWKMLESGLILSFFIIIVGLNLIFVEEAPEVYINSKILLKAVRDEANLGAGDVKVFHLLKEAATKLSNYYFGLSMLLIIFTATLPYLIELPMRFLALFLDLMVQAGGWAGIIGWEITIFLLALGFAVFQLLASRMKNRLFKYTIE
jgi:hypothetical protein